LNLDSTNFDRAEEALKNADTQIKPGSSLMGEKEELMGLLFEALGNTEEARRHFERSANAPGPPRPVPLRRLAVLAAKDQSWSEPAKWMERFLETKPQQLGHHWAVLGDYRLAAEQVEQGSKALETALHIDPYVYWGHFRMARVFEKNKETENAIKQYE